MRSTLFIHNPVVIDKSIENLKRVYQFCMNKIHCYRSLSGKMFPNIDQSVVSFVFWNQFCELELNTR